MNAYIVILSIFIAGTVSYLYPMLLNYEGFQSQTPIQKAKQLLSYMEFKGDGDDLHLLITTPGGIRIENGGLNVLNTDTNGLKLTQSSDIADTTNTTWTIKPDKNGILSTFMSSNNTEIPILGFSRNKNDGSYVVPTM